MISFAANSVFCRLALADPKNEPVSFTVVRLLSGALILFFFFVTKIKKESVKFNTGILLAPAMLFSYALFFSLSYVQIGAGAGALILFASVQLTMMMVALFRGQKLNLVERIGFSLAVIGFIYLLWPGLHMPPLYPASMMILSGISWGIYSLLGQKGADPIMATARNFLFTVPLSLILLFFIPISLTDHGLKFALASGLLTSGLGYILWYIVLKELSTSTAAIVQLCVPVIAALGGVCFLDESLSLRLLGSGILILTGITLKVKFSSVPKKTKVVV
jgi:drug/metabolite transporter (DMT)-like permease